MASFDLDPIFLKGLRLLHSKAKDSADQLRQLLEDVVNQKQSSALSSFPSKDNKSLIRALRMESETRAHGSKRASPKHSNESSSHSNKSSHSDEPKKREAEKRQYEKLKQELSDLCYEAKKPKTSSPGSSLSSSPSPQPPMAVKREEEYLSSGSPSATLRENTMTKGDLVNSVTLLAQAVTGGTGDAEDFAMEMGLVCVVCKQLEMAPKNQLIECQECHHLYHQECHRPAVTDNEVNDPRNVWYCVRCTKNMRKATKSHKSGKTPVVSETLKSSRETVISSSKMLKAPAEILPPPLPPFAASLPFKRSEIKPSSGSSILGAASSSTSHSSSKPTGLASLAANFGGRNSSVSTLASSSSLLSSKSGFGATKSGLSSLSGSSLGSKNPSGSGSAKNSGKGLSGLASLASAAAVASKATSSLTGYSRSSASSSAGSSGGSGANQGSSSSAGASVGPNGKSSSSLMSADKRLQIMKKKAAAKMQRRLSSK